MADLPIEKVSWNRSAEAATRTVLAAASVAEVALRGARDEEKNRLRRAHTGRTRSELLVVSFGSLLGLGISAALAGVFSGELVMMLSGGTLVAALLVGWAKRERKRIEAKLTEVDVEAALERARERTNMAESTAQRSVAALDEHLEWSRPRPPRRTVDEMLAHADRLAAALDSKDDSDSDIWSLRDVKLGPRRVTHTSASRS